MNPLPEPEDQLFIPADLEVILPTEHVDYREYVKAKNKVIEYENQWGRLGVEAENLKRRNEWLMKRSEKVSVDSEEYKRQWAQINNNSALMGNISADRGALSALLVDARNVEKQKQVIWVRTRDLSLIIEIQHWHKKYGITFWTGLGVLLSLVSLILSIIAYTR